ncbi:hypothetical protein V8J82_20810 [Gymnodinialimonas sp. 2305UL16-5]|uniref:hypothetical protein n=1 Tax=Gymnodinialimonas mytili TaxID=3126503 RepID=UPI0030ACE0A1
MRVLAYALFVLGLGLGTVAGFVFYAAFSDWQASGCPGPERCADAVGVMVLTGCAGVASLVMIFAGVVFARKSS